MFEELLRIIKQISDELQQEMLRYHKWYLFREKTANEDIAYNEKIRDDEKQPNVARVLASRAITNDCETMVMLAEDNILLNYMARLSRSSELAITTIEKELAELEKTATSKSANEYDEKIKHLETKLAQFQQENDSMRSYYDAIRKAMEKQKKWLDTNK